MRLTKKPLAQTAFIGGSARFSVAASGNGLLSYQWIKDGNPLTNDARISGATTPNLTVAPVQNADAGSYSVAVTDEYSTIDSANVSLIVQPDIIVPVVTITAPLLNARTNNLTVAGAVTDNIRIAHVFFWFTNINNGTVTISATNEAALHGTNVTRMAWDAVATPLPGTNILVAIAQDFQGNYSKPVSRSFFYRVPSPFTLTMTGNGSGLLTGKARLASGTSHRAIMSLLNVGESYTLTAVPDTNSFFTNWTGSLGTVTNSTISFIMEPDLTLQANFVTNLFIRMAGIYNGLFFANNSLDQARLETAGLIGNVTVSRLGVYSGKLVLGGLPYLFNGKFNMGGQTTNLIVRGAAAGDKVDSLPIARVVP